MATVAKPRRVIVNPPPPPAHAVVSTKDLVTLDILSMDHYFIRNHPTNKDEYILEARDATGNDPLTPFALYLGESSKYVPEVVQLDDGVYVLIFHRGTKE